MTAPTLRSLFATAFAVVVAASLGSCGGSPSPGTTVTDPLGLLVIQPGAGTILYSGLPTTFNVSGGTGQYVVSSSNQAALPINSIGVGRSFTIFPNPVLVNTDVTISVRDTGTALPISALVTVRPNTVVNSITFTPSATQPAGCNIAGASPTDPVTPGLCSGGDALITATLAQGGIPFGARGIRFEVIAGDIRFITSPVGVPEVLETTFTTVTDELGRGRARIRAIPLAPNQTAIIQITDVATGAFQRMTIFIAQFTGNNPAFFAVPSTVTFTGPRVGVCASNVSSTFTIFGGVAPYTITGTNSAFVVSPGVVNQSGGSFQVFPQGVCGSATISITDSTGRTQTVTATSQQGTQTVPEVTVFPETATLSGCNAVSTATVAGGLGGYVAASSSSSVSASVSGNILTMSRRAGGAAPRTGHVVSVTDGLTSDTVDVTLDSGAQGPCPFSLTPAAISFAACTPIDVAITGGATSPTPQTVPPTTPGYTVVTSNLGLTAAITGTNLRITRAAGTTMPVGSTHSVTVTDANGGTTAVQVNIAAGGVGPC